MISFIKKNYKNKKKKGKIEKIFPKPSRFIQGGLKSDPGVNALVSECKIFREGTTKT